MIILLSIVLFFCAGYLLLMARPGPLEHELLYMLAAFVMLIAATGNAMNWDMAPAANINYTALTTNTLYQNTNASSLMLYITSQGAYKAWLGFNTTMMFLAINQTQTTGPLVVDGNQTSTLVVPEGFYYKMNYTTANVLEVQAT